MKIAFIIIIFFSIPLFGFSQSHIDDIKSNMEGTWKEQGLTKKQHNLNKIRFSSDTTGQWYTEGIICDCEFFKIYVETNKVFIKRLIILNGWSDPIEIVSADEKKLVVKHFDGKVYSYKRNRESRY